MSTYEINRVHCTDAEALLAGIEKESAAMVVLDPPGRIGIDGAYHGDHPFDEMLTKLIPIGDKINKALMPGGVIVVVGSAVVHSTWDFVAAYRGFKYIAEIVVLWKLADGRKWRERAASPTSRASVIRWYRKPGHTEAARQTLSLPSNVLTAYEIPVAERLSYSELPIELFNYLITALTLPGDLVVDPFCGSGAALVSAESTDRLWIGGDNDKRMCDIAARRVQKAMTTVTECRPLAMWTPAREIALEG